MNELKGRHLQPDEDIVMVAIYLFKEGYFHQKDDKKV